MICFHSKRLEDWIANTTWTISEPGSYYGFTGTATSSLSRGATQKRQNFVCPFRIFHSAACCWTLITLPPAKDYNLILNREISLKAHSKHSLKVQEPVLVRSLLSRLLLVHSMWALFPREPFFSAGIFFGYSSPFCFVSSSFNREWRAINFKGDAIKNPVISQLLCADSLFDFILLFFIKFLRMFCLSFMQIERLLMFIAHTNSFLALHATTLTKANLKLIN